MTNVHRYHLSVYPFLLILALFLAPVSTPAETQTLLQVEVLGLEDPLKGNVLHFLKIVKMKDDERLNPRWIERLHQQAPEEIREALQPYGYYLPDIESTLSETDGTWFASYTIDKGEPVEISKRDIQWQGPGAADQVFQQSITEYLENSGKLLIHSEYEAEKSTFLNLALSNGYPKASILKSEILVDLETNHAEVTLHMDTGPLYYFGEISFEQDFLDPDLLQKYVTLKTGDPYSHEALLEFQQNLIASNYAQEVTIIPQYDAVTDDQFLPLNVVMQPIAPHKISLGIGYESDVGPRVSARWVDRLINRYGHHSNVYVKLAEKEGRVRVSYSIPVHKPLTDRWVSTANYDYEETPTTNSSTFEMETAFVRRNLENTHFLKGFVLASSEKFTVGHDPRQTTDLLILGATMRFSDIEDDLYPQNGYYLFADLRGAAEALLSTTSFTRLHIQGRYLHEFGVNGRLDSRMEIGTTWVEDFDVYPASLRFFAGGDNSVRGYQYQSLGPVDNQGIVVGGKQVFTGSVEYDHRLAESWVLAGFVDAGNAYNDEVDKLYVGSGFGFRWLAPFGSLRVDLAWPVSEDPDLGDLRLHIGFGATL